MKDINHINYKSAGGEKSIQIRINKVTGGQLKREQMDVIEDALSQMNLNIAKKKEHFMEITILSEARFSVRIDNKYDFFVSKKKDYSKEKRSQVVIIQDKINKKTLFESFKDLFRGIFHLFYKPAYPSIEDKNRSHLKAVEQDYRALRKGFEAGQRWLSKESEVHVSPREQKTREKLLIEVGSSIENANQVEKSLKSRDQAGAFSNLSRKLSKEISDLGRDESLVVPAGYLNKDNVLQPIMYRFYRNEEHELFLEIYSDAADGTSKVSPIVLKKFEEKEPNAKDLQKLLEAIFDPLVDKSIREKEFLKVVQPSETFGMILEAKKQEKGLAAAPLGIQSEKTATVSTDRITYEILLRTLDKQMDNKWADESKGEILTPPKTPGERLRKWFDHLTDRKLSQNEKIDLLFYMTDQWIGDQMFQAEKVFSLEARRGMYQEILGTIEHVKKKIAIEIAEGQHDLAEFGIPKTLKSKEEECRKNIAHLSQRIRKGKIELTGSQLQKSQSSKVSIPITGKTPPPGPMIVEGKLERLPQTYEEQTTFLKTILKGTISDEKLDSISEKEFIEKIVPFLTDQKFLKQVLKGIVKNKIDEMITSAAQYKYIPKPKISPTLVPKAATELQAEWKEISSNLTTLFSEEHVQLEQNREVVQSLYRTIELVKSPENEQILNQFVNKVASKGEIDEQELRQFLEVVLKDSGYANQFMADATGISFHDVDTLISVFEQLILCPHLIPYYGIIEGYGGCGRGVLNAGIRKIEDPNSFVPWHLIPVFQALRSVLLIRNLISPESRKKLLLDRWAKQPEQFLESEINSLIYLIIDKWDQNDQNRKFLEDPKKSIQDKIEKLKMIQLNASDREQLNAILSHYELLKNQMQKADIDSVSEILAQAPQIENRAEILKVGESENYRTEIVKGIKRGADHIRELQKLAIVQTDTIRKREILEEIRLRSYEIIQKLPVPGTEGSEGVPSIWYEFSEKERNQLFSDLHELEHAIWEAKLQGSDIEMTGREQLLFVKAQVIRQALIRAKLNETKEAFRKILEEDLKNGRVQLQAKFPRNVIGDGQGRYFLEFTGPTPVALDLLEEYIKEKIQKKEITEQDAYKYDTTLLVLERVTLLDTEKINELFTQNLTTQLSSDPELHRQLLALHHFVIRDFNAGAQDNLSPTTTPSLIIPLKLLEEYVREKIQTKKITEQDADKYNTILLVLGKETLLDTEKINELFKQDLTSLRSSDPELNRQLLALHHLRTSPSLTLLGKRKEQFREFTSLDVMAAYNPRNQCPVIDIKGKSEACKKILEDAEASYFYFRTALDPNFSLHSLAPSLGTSFFEAEPELLLQQSRLDIRCSGSSSDSKVAIDDRYAIVNQEGIEVAEVCTEGHPEVCQTVGSARTFSEEEKKKLISPRKPFNPVIKNDPTEYENENKISDIRLAGSFDVWLQNAPDAFPESISLSTRVKLSQIRQAPYDNRNGLVTTSYAAATAFKALDFITDQENETDLQLDYVQNFLLESLFGSFVLQQAIIDNPRMILSTTEQLATCLEIAKKKKNVALVSFYTDVIHRLHDQMQITSQALQTQGYFSGAVNGSLPEHMGREGGAFGFFQRELRKIEIGNEREAIDRPIDSFGAQVLLERISLIQECMNTLQDCVQIADEVYTSVCTPEGEARPIDQEQRPTTKKMLYIYILEDYRRKKLDLTPEKFVDILMGYELLCNPDIETNLKEKQQELIRWIRGEVFPLILENNELRKGIFQAILREKFKDPGLIVESTKLLENSLSTFEVVLRDKTTQINLYSMDIQGLPQELSVRYANLPNEIVKQKAFAQAIKFQLKAKHTKLGVIDKYEWTQDGQEFLITKRGKNIEIRRIVHDGPFAGTYTFVPIIQSSSNDHANSLVAENGLWMKEEELDRGYIFPGGASKPKEEEVFTASIRQVGGRMEVSEVKNIHNRLVSSSMGLQGPSPVLFAASKHAMALLDPETKKPVEIRFKDSPLHLKKEGDDWIAYVQGVKQGKIIYPENEKILVDAFGERWDQFVIPVQKEKTEKKLVNGTFTAISSIENNYIVIPYPQAVDAKGQSFIQQESASPLKTPIIFRTDSDGSLKGSIAGELYLAQTLIARSAKTKNRTVAREMLTKAQSHLSNIKNERPSADPDEIEQLKQIFDQITKFKGVGPEHHSETIALELKLHLMIQKIRKQAADQNVKDLILSPRQNFEEREFMTKLYEAYLAHQTYKTGTIQAVKESFRLSQKERVALQRISETLLQDIATTIVQENFETYFGISPRIKETVSIDLPYDLDPQFLLTLLRIGKAFDEDISFDKVTPPIPLEDLLENFLSYFASIKREGKTVEQLFFLFRESTIPAGKSKEQLQMLKRIDAQARQFLLTFAKLLEEIGTEDPYQKVEEEIKTKKDLVLEKIGGSKVEGLCAQFSTLQPKLKLLQNRIPLLMLEERKPEKMIKCPDAKKFENEIGEIKKDAESLNLEVLNIIGGCQKLIEEVDKQNRDFEIRINGLREELLTKGLSEEQIKQDRGWIQLQDEYEAFRNIDELMPGGGVTGEDTIPRQEIINGGLQEIVKNLQLAHSGFSELIGNLDFAAKAVKQCEALVDKIIEMEELYKTITHAKFEPSPWLVLPEKGAAKGLVKELIVQGKKPELSKKNIIAVVDFLKEAGIYKSAKTAQEFARSQKLIEKIEEQRDLKETLIQITERSDEENEQLIHVYEEIIQLEEQFRTSLFGKLEVFALPLFGLVEFSKILGEPISFGEGIPKGKERVQISDLDEYGIASRFFTPSEIEKMNQNISKLDPTEQISVLEALSKSLQLSQTIVNQKIDLGNQIKEMDRLYMHRTFPNLLPELPDRDLSLEGLSRGQEFKKDVLKHYRGKSEFKDEIYSVTIADAMTDSGAEIQKAKTTFSKQIQEEKPLKENIRDFVNKLLEKDDPELQPYFEALEMILQSFDFVVDEATHFNFHQQLFLRTLGEIRSRKELLVAIEAYCKLLGPFVHQQKHLAQIEELKKSLPEEGSLYHEDLKKGVENLGKNNPLPFTEVAQETKLDPLAKAISDEMEKIEQEIILHKTEALNLLKKIPPGELPKDLLRLRSQKKSDEELFQATLKEFRKGAFPNQPELEKALGAYLIDHTRLQAFVNPKNSASSSLANLQELKEKKGKLKSELNRTLRDERKINRKLSSYRDIESAKKALDDEIELLEERKVLMEDPNYTEKIRTPEKIRQHWFELATIKDEIKKYSFQRKEIDQLLHSQKLIKAQREDLEAELRVVDLKWERESRKIEDFSGRCQSTEHIETITQTYPKLVPHLRKILYLQDRLGVVLRPNQLETLNEIVTNPSLLKQLRMGLGKTSIILPFALEILAAEGYNPIGIVPKALFGTNFKEMGETTRLVFELSGNQFLFSREDAPLPLNTPHLAHLVQKCHDFLDALEKREFVLTSIESKASLDDKIAEIESSQKEIQKNDERVKIDLQEADDSEKEALIRQHETLYQSLVNHQVALDALYRVKGVFEHPNTRIIMDEADQVARANYTVNSEKGIKEPLNPGLQQAITNVFDIIRDVPELSMLREQIRANNQFTFTDEQINEYIYQIGKIWLKEHQGKYPEELYVQILLWFTGADSPFTPEQIHQLDRPFRLELETIRRTLNSALRSSFHHKIGLNGEFDPLNKAVGVPASQGVTSKTTKYSDPLMQLCLTNLIAFYKPQGETFLRSTVRKVSDNLSKRKEQLEKKIKEEQENLNTEERKNIRSAIQRKIDKISSELDLISRAQELIQNLFEEQKESGVIPTYSQEFQGNDPVKSYIRQQFSIQVVEQQLVYVTGEQISRPVQDCLRGCNVIGLTGTATRNTEYLVTSNGNANALDGMKQAGRETTAEVLLRMAKALDQGLETEVKTYSMQTEESLKQLQMLAKDDSGYNYLVNQAGVCDKLLLEEIVDQLHLVSGRPIIHLRIDAEGKSFKAVLINGEVKKLDRLTGEENEQVAKRGFYYYHTPHVRGTHFDIPTGSKGALLLSATVNANDRDQAAYRARELGEGHRIEIWISEKQKENLQQDLGKETICAGDVFKVHHNKTNQDEQPEDLSAYKLHIQGFLKKQAEDALQEIQVTKKKFKTLGNWEENVKTHEDFFQRKTKIFEIFEKFFIQGSGNRAYAAILDQEIFGKAEEDTQEILQRMINNELEKSKTLLAQLKAENQKNPSPELGVAIAHIEKAKERLMQEREKFSDTEFIRNLEKQFPKKSSSSTNIDATEETEVQTEEEVQTESQTEVESQIPMGLKSYGEMSEKLKNTQADFVGKSIEPVDKSALVHLSAKEPLSSFKDYADPGWKENVLISKRLQRQMKSSFGPSPEINLLVMERADGEPLILAVDAYEAQQNTSTLGFPITNNDARSKKHRFSPLYSVKVQKDGRGDIMIKYGSEAMLTPYLMEEFEDRSLKAEIALTLMELGHTNFESAIWDSVFKYWTGLTQDQQNGLKTKFERALSRNPSFLETMGKHLWKKEKLKAARVGQVRSIEGIVSMKKGQLERRLEKGESLTYEDLFAASRETAEDELGRELTPEEEEELRNKCRKTLLLEQIRKFRF